jgi:8-oxo-dGTP pyrophosphatase MutT (NUDIX family)
MNAKSMYCNNCGNKGHIFKTCKDPVTSCGLLLLRGSQDPLKLPSDPITTSVLMVKRKDSMAYMEFIRGKYDPENTDYVQRLITNMTKQEQTQIVTEDFDTLWTKLWGAGRDTRSSEYYTAKENYEKINRKELVELAPTVFTEPEWGFPKGRRSKGETDLVCALREFWEETNIPSDAYEIISSLSFTEIFTGTNDVNYKHIYFVAVMKDSSLLPNEKTLTNVQKREVSEVGWKTFAEAKDITRPHYVQRKKILNQLERIIQEYQSV